MHSAKPDSAIVADQNPDVAEWATTFKTNVILADIYDAIAWLTAITAASGSGKKPKQPKEYPRSWRKKPKAFTKVMKAKDWLKMIGGDEDG